MTEILEIKEIKQELYNLYKAIQNSIKENNINLNDLTDIQDISYYDCSALIDNIKNITTLSLTYNNNFKNEEIKLSNNKNKEEHYIQMESMIKKLEFDIKYYLKNLLHYKIQNNSLEQKINSLMSIEEDYEDLKQKVKYDGSKFLENDRKENEIMILKNENSKMKKVITNLERQKLILENEKNELYDKVKKLENDNKLMDEKIIDLEKNIQEKKNNDNNININTNKKIQKNFHNMININNNTNINKPKRIVNFLSPRDDKLYLEHLRDNKINNKTLNSNPINNNLFTATYNKIAHGINANKLFPFRKDLNILKYTRNKSLFSLKGIDNESKTMSYNNKINIDKNETFKQKSGNKQKNFAKMINNKNKQQYSQYSAFSLSNNSSKDIFQNDKKNINKNFIRNGSAKNMKIYKI
jgi:hypothetical protein